MGKKKIPIKEICNRTDLANTYRKRKPGLLKKAYEIVQLCGVEIKMLLSDIDEHVHYYSHTKSKNSSFSDKHIGKIIRENKLMTYSTDDLRGVFAELNADTVMVDDDDRSSKSFNLSTKNAANSKTPEQFTEAHKKKMMKEKNVVTDIMLKKREIAEFVNMDFFNQNMHSVATKIPMNEAFREKLPPIPLLSSISKLDEKFVNIPDVRMKDQYKTLSSKLNLANSYFYNLGAIIITQTFRYLLDCYHNVEVNENNQMDNISLILNQMLSGFPKEELIKFQDVIAKSDPEKPLMEKLWCINDELLKWIFKMSSVTPEAGWMFQLYHYTYNKIKELNLEFQSINEVEACIKMFLGSFVNEKIRELQQLAFKEKLMNSDPSQINLYMNTYLSNPPSNISPIEKNAAMFFDPNQANNNQVRENDNSMAMKSVPNLNNYETHSSSPTIYETHRELEDTMNTNKQEKNYGQKLGLSNYEDNSQKMQKYSNLEIQDNVKPPDEEIHNEFQINPNVQQTPKFGHNIPQNMQHITKMFPYAADFNQPKIEPHKMEYELEKKDSNSNTGNNQLEFAQRHDLEKRFSNYSFGENSQRHDLEKKGSNFTFGENSARYELEKLSSNYTSGSNYLENIQRNELEKIDNNAAIIDNNLLNTQKNIGGEQDQINELRKPGKGILGKEKTELAKKINKEQLQLGKLSNNQGMMEESNEELNQQKEEDQHATKNIQKDQEMLDPGQSTDDRRT